MQIHQLKPKHKLKNKKRIGRGGKRGTYSGKGVKGQKSRAGKKFEPIIRGLIKRYPKLKGYKFKAKPDFGAVVNLGLLEKKFNSEEQINPNLLIEKKIIRRIRKKAPIVKILGKGKLTKKFIIEGCVVSKSAKEKIEKAKGAVK
ncbi:50S ribosomal protein L15 [Candidatus Parcubacteria bacterium]|nr:50S ribosomal protein L15 [Candidatus Parcubacteria bacterium]